MKFTKGMYRDIAQIDQIPGSWRKAKNIVYNARLGSISNEPGFGLNNDFGDRSIVGVIPVDNDQSILFLTDLSTPGKDSEIVRLDGTAVTSIIKDDSLYLTGFNTLRGIWWRNYKNELIVQWTDNTTPPRILNVDNPGIELNTDKSFANDLQLALLNITPEFSTPINSFDIVPGGSLKSGAYYICIAYELPDGTTTDYSAIRGPVSITDDNTGENWAEIDGAPADAQTGNAISLAFNGIDTRYQWIRIYFIKRIGGTTEAAYVARVPINDTFLTYTYLGTEDISAVNLEDILTDNLNITKAKAIAQYNNKTYLANFSLKDNDIGYQPYANGIEVGWVFDDEVSLTRAEDSFKNGALGLTLRGWMPDEVMDLYIGFILTDGRQSPGYHIPGTRRHQITKTFYDDNGLNGSSHTFYVDATIQSIIDAIKLEYPATYRNYPFWRYGNSMIDIDSDIRFFHLFDTWQSSPNRLGFWENQDETYPDTDDFDVKNLAGQVIDTIRGENVRHHKIPSLSGLLDYHGEKWLNKEITAGDGSLHIEKIDFAIDSHGYPLTGFTTVSDPLSDINSYRTNATTENTTNPLNHEYKLRHTALQAQRVEVHGTLLFSLLANNSQSLFVQFYVKHFDYSGVLKNTIFVESDSDSLEARIEKSITSVTVDMETNDYIEIYWYYAASSGIGDSDWRIELDGEVVIQSYEPGSLVVPTIEQWKGKVIGLTLSNIIIPDDILSEVVGYEILYAKRTADNMTIAGQSMFFFGSDHPVNEDNKGSYAGNMRQFVVADGSGNTDTSVGSLHDDIVRIHPFDILNEKPAIAPTHLKPHVVMNGTYRRGWDHDNSSKTKVRADDVSGLVEATDEQHVTFLMDTMIDIENEGVSDPVSQDFCRKIKDWKYLPADTYTSFHDNTHSEECMYLSLDHGKDAITSNIRPYEYNPITDDIGFSSWNTTEQTLYKAHPHWIGDVAIHKRNVYRPFTTQELVTTGWMFPVASFSNEYTIPKVYGGDTFLSLYSLRLTSGYRKEQPAGTLEYASLYSNQSVATVVQFPCYSVANIGLRHENSDGSGAYYPNSTGNIPVGTTDDSVWQKANDALFWNAVDQRNQIEYNEDYSKVNDLNPFVPYDTYAEFLSDFPYRVIRSKDYQPDSKELTQRVFRPNDYYEMPHNRGEAVNIDVLSERLLIHMKYSLFMTVSKDTLETDASLIALGSGDLFRLPPEEALTSDNGYAGLQHLSAAKVFKIGYVFVDAEMGKVFLLPHGAREPLEISKQGLRNDFRDDIIGYYGGYPDAPWLAGGFSLSYDEEFNRVILSIKRLLKQTTVSFTPDINGWLAEHDYTPTISWNTRNNLYHVSNGLLYQANQDGYGKFFNGTIYPSNIDFIINTEPSLTKVFSSIQWISEVIGTYSDRDKTFTKIAAYNRYQCTGWIDLSRLSNVRSAEGTWKFNELRDISTDNQPFIDANGEFINLNTSTLWYNKKRMVDKYLQVILEYNNSDQQQIILHEVSALLRLSKR